MAQQEQLSPVDDCVMKIMSHLEDPPGKIVYHDYDPVVEGVAETDIAKVFAFTGHDSAVIEAALEILESQRFIERSQLPTNKKWSPTGSKGQPNSRQITWEIVRV